MTDHTGGTSSSTANTSSSASASNAAASPKASKGKKSKAGSAASKAKKANATSAHPKYAVMVKQALIQLGNRNGSSRALILKYIISNYKVNAATANQHLKSALRAGTKNKSLKQVKGVGASGSFKVADAVKKSASSAGKKKTTTTQHTTNPCTKKERRKETLVALWPSSLATRFIYR